MILNAQLRCKDTEIRTTPCEVVCVVELSQYEFESFRKNALGDYPFIHAHLQDLTASTHDASPCLLVLCEGAEDGILVDPQGYDYARYTAYVPNARMMLEQEQQLSMSQDDPQDLTL